MWGIYFGTSESGDFRELGRMGFWFWGAADFEGLIETDCGKPISGMPLSRFSRRERSSVMVVYYHRIIQISARSCRKGTHGKLENGVDRKMKSIFTVFMYPISRVLLAICCSTSSLSCCLFSLFMIVRDSFLVIYPYIRLIHRYISTYISIYI